MVLLNWANLVTGLGLFLLLLVACLAQWPTMRPSARLFSLAFGLYIAVAVSVTAVSLAHGSDSAFQVIRGAALLVANTWLFIATYALHREWLRDPDRSKRS